MLFRSDLPAIMMTAVDGVARIMMAGKSMPVKGVSGESVRVKGAAHMDRTVGCKAMEAAKTMHAPTTKRRMETSTAAEMHAAASAAVKAARPFRHCRDIRRKAERTDGNAGRKNSYGSLDRGVHGRFSIVIVPAKRNNRGRARILKLFTFQLFSPIAGF